MSPRPDSLKQPCVAAVAGAVNRAECKYFRACLVAVARPVSRAECRCSTGKASEPGVLRVLEAALLTLLIAIQ